MITHAWSVVCRESVTNADNNILSINNVLEEVTLTPGPGGARELESTLKKQGGVAIPVYHEIISLLNRAIDSTQESVDLRIEYIDPQEKVLNEIRDKIVFDKGKFNMRARVVSQNQVITGPGMYHYNVYLKNKGDDEIMVASIPVRVLIAK